MRIYHLATNDQACVILGLNDGGGRGGTGIKPYPGCNRCDQRSDKIAARFNLFNRQRINLAVTITVNGFRINRTEQIIDDDA